MIPKALTALVLTGSLIIGTNNLLAADGKPDADFATKAAKGGMAEVKLGHLATEKGSTPAVKEFGHHMVMDHTKANNDLKSVAAAKHMELPKSIGEKHQATYDRLAKLSGKEFDRAYIADMLKDHQEDVAEFRQESKGGKDPEIKSFATRTLPVLESHLAMVEKVSASEGKHGARQESAKKKGGLFGFLNRA